MIKSIIVFIFSFLIATAAFGKQNNYEDSLKSLESRFNRNLGVYALDTNTGNTIAYRADEAFPFQSTVKVLIASLLLQQSEKTPALLSEKVAVKEDDIVFWSPVSSQYLSGEKVSLEVLAEAAVSLSDNAATNILMQHLGGYDGITAYAQSLGNKSFNLKHFEPNFNSNPKIKTDTSTPKDMAVMLEKLLFGNELSASNQKKLLTWMQNNTTGYKKIRAALPIGWSAAEKTGGGGTFAINNDIGVIWSPACKPIILSIYTSSNQKEDKGSDMLIAETTQLVMDTFSASNKCFEQTVL